jgi:hypothetical protein
MQQVLAEVVPVPVTMVVTVLTVYLVAEAAALLVLAKIGLEAMVAKVLLLCKVTTVQLMPILF